MIKKYKKNTAGWIMSEDLISVKECFKIGEVVEVLKMKRNMDRFKEVHLIFVVDEGGKLVGYLSLRKLIVSGLEAKVYEVMSRGVISVGVDMDQEEVSKIVKRYDVVLVGVVDGLGRLLGAIGFDEVMDVVDEEVAEDMGKGVGLIEEKEGWIWRFPWLMMGLVGGFLGAWIIGLLGRDLEEIVILSLFIPMILSMGGNVGIQASTVILRRMILSEVDIGFRFDGFILKEMRTVLLNGLLCSGLIFVGGIFFFDIKIGLTLGLSLLIVMNISGLLGGILPMVLKKMRIDPVISTGPLMAMMSDVVSLVIYLGIAQMIHGLWVYIIVD